MIAQCSPLARPNYFLSVTFNGKRRIDFTRFKCADTVNLCGFAATAIVIISVGSRHVWPEPHDNNDDGYSEFLLHCPVI